MIVRMDDRELRELLEREASRVCRPEFALSDPVQFPRRFTSLPDVEVVSLLVAAIAWGNRKMICRDAERLLELMEGQPAAWMMDGAWEAVPDELNIHRTFFGRNLKHALRGLREVYGRHGSLDAYSAAIGAGDTAAPAWTLVEHLNADIAAANGGTCDSRFLPSNQRTSALKRVNMALRWLVRDDGIVDMGLWHSIRPSQLFIPLDVHVGNTARSLGLTSRHQADRRTTIEITDVLRRLRPDDPIYYDYALFGLGIDPQ